jgi:hypothetical protein
VGHGHVADTVAGSPHALIQYRRAIGATLGYGHYYFETYAKVEGHWRIKTMNLAYLRTDRTIYSTGTVERAASS